MKLSARGFFFTPGIGPQTAKTTMHTPRPGFHPARPAHDHFQYLEDLATAYWYSEALFAALDLGVFASLDRVEAGTLDLAQDVDCHPEALERLLALLADLGLLLQHAGRWANSPLTRRHLVPGAPGYLGDFLLYRRYLQPRWQGLAGRTSRAPLSADRLSADADYATRNWHYVRAQDRLLGQKAREITPLLQAAGWQGPILDAGGGAGALSRHLVSAAPGTWALVADLPEVLAAGRRLYPETADRQRVHGVACDLRLPPFRPGAGFGLVILSNFLHAYGPAEARALLQAALKLAAPAGSVLVHDYFPDRAGASGPRGAAQHLNMLLNTFQGTCHRADTVADWLAAAGWRRLTVHDLPSDSAVILARGPEAAPGSLPDPEAWDHRARRLGLAGAVEIPAAAVATAPWTRVKCRFGCAGYGQGRQCPPGSPDDTATARLLKDYRRALVLVGQPPGRQFHQQILAMEKAAFLQGFHKALVFGAGPCPVCDTCPPEGPCRLPDQARPSMEASGMDVYATAAAAGIPLAPVRERDGFVTYIGLLLLE
jgi:predicted metal-binding protein/SAM-dependent methyltransferase